jgi:hypothetical protein
MRERLAMQKLAGLPVQDVVERVSICLDQHLSKFAPKLHIDQNGNFVGILVMGIEWSELEGIVNLGTKLEDWCHEKRSASSFPS